MCKCVVSHKTQNASFNSYTTVMVYTIYIYYTLSGSLGPATDGQKFKSRTLYTDAPPRAKYRLLVRAGGEWGGIKCFSFIFFPSTYDYIYKYYFIYVQVFFSRHVQIYIYCRTYKYFSPFSSFMSALSRRRSTDTLLYSIIIRIFPPPPMVRTSTGNAILYYIPRSIPDPSSVGFASVFHDRAVKYNKNIFATIVSAENTLVYRSPTLCQAVKTVGSYDMQI